VQYYRMNYGGGKPSPALVKAALINSAADMDDSVETDPVPTWMKAGDESTSPIDRLGLSLSFVVRLRL